jgi:hypothetical protein
MIKSNNAARAFQKRTIRPLYAWHSAVPYAAFLDTTTGAITGTLAIGTSTVVYPGMVAVKTTGEQMRLAIGQAAVPAFGLFNNFINGAMDELGGGTEIGVWVGGRDAVFEILAGPNSSETPLDPAVTWTTGGKNDTVGGVALYANAAGRLSDAAAGLRVARLVEVVSNSKLIVQLSLAEA